MTRRCGYYKSYIFALETIELSFMDDYHASRYINFVLLR
jgi:hypothetical protein